ncbi:hypothetical protein QBC44DRAFT_327686 [Cladorrhinum sp. PSN332]|nr:hypothetical protein QBC44DRAFT_327686 [Cladorrhinum sp. PSN332]
MSTFPQFSNFPFELRYQIWVDSIPDDEAQVNLDPFFNFQRDATWPRPPLPIGFPAMMHTRHEARTVALEQFKKRYWPVLVRAQGHGLNVPRRDFIPELDILYMEPGYRGERFVRSYEILRDAARHEQVAPEVRRLRYIAFPWMALPYQAVLAMPSLHYTYIVICDDWPLPPVPDVPGPPWDRRFKLEDITEDEKKNGVPLTMIHPQRRDAVNTFNAEGLVDIQSHAESEESWLRRTLEDRRDEHLVKEWWENRPEKGMPVKIEVKRLVRAPPWYKP